MDVGRLYDQHLSLIESTIRSTCRQLRLPIPDAEDFAQDARLRLLSDNGRLLKAVTRARNPRHYLAVLLRHQWTSGQWTQYGRWRPSAAARRLGPLAVQLERLIAREHMSTNEAIETICSRTPEHGIRNRLENLIHRLRPHSVRQLVPDNMSARRSDDASADERILEVEDKSLAKKLLSVMRYALTLSEWRELQSGARGQTPRRGTQLPAAVRYERTARLRQKARRRMIAAGVRRDEVASALARHAFDLIDPNELKAYPWRQLRTES